LPGRHAAKEFTNRTLHKLFDADLFAVGLGDIHRPFTQSSKPARPFEWVDLHKLNRRLRSAAKKPGSERGVRASPFGAKPIDLARRNLCRPIRALSRAVGRTGPSQRRARRDADA